MEKRFIKGYFVKVFVLLAAVSLVVIMADPFYHYHEPVSPLKKILDTPEYQCVGSVENFTYDSIILGSSVAENYNNRLFNEKFDCNVIKAIQHSGTTKDLLFYLDKAYDNHELRYVFYSLDLAALTDDAINVTKKNMPLYLFNDNPFDDVKYLWNKDVLFEKIPYMVAQSMAGYDEDLSYNWAKYKTFSKETALANYSKPEKQEEKEPTQEQKKIVEGNVKSIASFVESHPETIYYFIYPPYSELWWEGVTLEGQRPLYEYASKLSMDILGQHSNVKINNFQNEIDIITNLDLYMDPIHFSGDINDWIVEQLK